MDGIEVVGVRGAYSDYVRATAVSYPRRMLAFARFVHGHDAIMVYPGLELAFSPKALPERDIVAQVRGEDLEREMQVEEVDRLRADGVSPEEVERATALIETEFVAALQSAGDRADKIRTYNFPQDRVTDHRVGLDLSNLPKVLGGDLDRLINELLTTDQAERLSALVEADPGP